jgi:hypothetical protein
MPRAEEATGPRDATRVGGVRCRCGGGVRCWWWLVGARRPPPPPHGGRASIEREGEVRPLQLQAKRAPSRQALGSPLGKGTHAGSNKAEEAE